MNAFDFDDSAPLPPRAGTASRRGKDAKVLWATAIVFVLIGGALAFLASRDRRPPSPREPQPPSPPTVNRSETERLTVMPRMVFRPPTPEEVQFREEHERRLKAAMTRPPEAVPALDFKNIDPEPLHSAFVVPKKDAKTGFVVGGRNSSALIRTLTEMNGRTIADLESDMRPEFPNETPHRSGSGFLKIDQNLLEVLAADNDYVLGTLKLTHQDLARPLKAMFAAGRWLEKIRPDGWPRRDADWLDSYTRMRRLDGPVFYFHGRRFRLVYTAFKGDQDSPFLDDTRTNKDVILANLETGKMLKYSLLVPEMIERYGFYEGPDTPYRVDPKDIVEVLDFLRPS
jgi:hypothetical protein